MLSISHELLKIAHLIVAADIEKSLQNLGKKYLNFKGQNLKFKRRDHSKGVESRLGDNANNIGMKTFEDKGKFYLYLTVNDIFDREVFKIGQEKNALRWLEVILKDMVSMKLEIPNVIKKRFKELNSEIENLGEYVGNVPISFLRKKQREYKKEWEKLEKSLGRKVLGDEVFEWYT